jgi:hypothetical protein
MVRESGGGESGGRFWIVDFRLEIADFKAMRTGLKSAI